MSSLVSSLFWPQLLPELAEHIISFLPPNEVACTVRLINKAAAAQFSGPRFTTVKLSSPVPEHAFAQHWGRPGAMRGLTHKQRLQLLCLTARSGSTRNLELGIASAGLALPPVSYLGIDLMKAAGAAGHLEACAWLWQQHGCPLYAAIAGAAGGGHRAICEWGLAAGCPWNDSFAFEAACGGHVGLMEWLLQLCPPGAPPCLARYVVQAAAVGCGLADLQRLHHAWLGVEEQQGNPDAGQFARYVEIHKSCTLAAAARSRTPDWQAKVEWLEARGYPKSVMACSDVAACADAEDRLKWLHSRGYPLPPLIILERLAAEGSCQALQYLLGAGMRPPAACSRRAAAAGGQLAALQLLHDHGCPMDADTVRAAASAGHLHVLVWLVEVMGDELLLDVEVFIAAAQSGNLELLRWLRERGCPWDGETFAEAASGGCEEALEWLVEQGCPMGDDGRPYLAADYNGDTAIRNCLRRLGCPGGTPAGRADTTVAGLGLHG
ncbi:hypothetical protein Agub_g6856 [Astrephomene gubernaculifera]|uniref:Ankyrin repeat domain-containing protein n=1 Tax=Astrephomene gubernaculifera TaxID=47775 RepID=A0AAD3DQR1_9CHLO|nr:hypothetical protein Agub_g6856 [Astrephomene gubernaculifera]